MAAVAAPGAGEPDDVQRGSRHEPGLPAADYGSGNREPAAVDAESSASGAEPDSTERR